MVAGVGLEPTSGLAPDPTPPMPLDEHHWTKLERRNNNIRVHCFILPGSPSAHGRQRPACEPTTARPVRHCLRPIWAQTWQSPGLDIEPSAAFSTGGRSMGMSG